MTLSFSRILSPFRTVTIEEELSHEILSKQRELIQNEIEQIKMNHRVMCSKAILGYLSRISAELSKESSSSSTDQ
jgi:hypothetical protein